MHVLDELEARGFVKQVVDAPGLRARMDAGPIPPPTAFTSVTCFR